MRNSRGFLSFSLLTSLTLFGVILSTLIFHFAYPPKQEVLRAIQAVANGEAIFSPGVARRMMGFFKGTSRSEQPPAFPELSEREQEILSLIAKGQSNTEIAAKLVLSLKTVQNHVSNILNKLQLADRVQAAIRAREAGLG